MSFFVVVFYLDQPDTVPINIQSHLKQYLLNIIQSGHQRGIHISKSILPTLTLEIGICKILFFFDITIIV